MAISSVGSSSAAIANRPAHKADGDKNAKDASKADKTAEADEAEQGDGTGSMTAMHSVVAGALGLDDPTVEKPKEEENKFYTAGKVMAAIGTVGTILSVLA